MVTHPLREAKPIKVMLDARFRAQAKGGDRCKYELARELKSDAIDLTLLAFPETEHLLRAARPDVAIEICHAKPSQHPKADWFEHLSLPRLIRRSGCQIYHGTFNVMPCFGTPNSGVVTIHDLAVFAMPEAYSTKFAAYARLLVRRAVATAQRIIVISEATRLELLKYIPSVDPRKISVVLNGVGSQFLDVFGTTPDASFERLRNLNLRRPYVLFVGNLERKKNLSRLIDAYVSLRRRGVVDADLVIAGDRPDKLPDWAGGKILPDEGDGVRFAGYVPDALLPHLYRAAAAVAYPSLYEGFGMPVLEAMAAGTPVLTSSVSSLPEVAGGAAVLVDPLDVESIADGLRKVLRDDGWRDAAIRLGRERAERLTWKTNAMCTLRVYEELASSGFA